ncbi:MAG TPA: hypothetical protein PKE30_17275 [Niabella sp.]|nr:hypothetical protein [Niabella sp.]
MKKGEIHTDIIIAKTGAAFFALIMLFNIAVQGFHSHHPKQVTCEHAVQDTLTSYSAPCTICDHFQYRNHSDIPFLSHIEITPLLPTVPIHGGRYYIGFYKFTLQGFTNKGPPAGIAIV